MVSHFKGCVVVRQRYLVWSTLGHIHFNPLTEMNEKVHFVDILYYRRVKTRNCKMKFRLRKKIWLCFSNLLSYCSQSVGNPIKPCKQSSSTSNHMQNLCSIIYPLMQSHKKSFEIRVFHKNRIGNKSGMCKKHLLSRLFPVGCYFTSPFVQSNFLNIFKIIILFIVFFAYLKGRFH